jgi:hypothetical protein
MWKKIHVRAISSGRTKHIKPKINHQKGICAIGILQLEQMLWSASFNKLWIMSDDWKLAILNRKLDVILGHLISFSIIYLYPLLILSLTLRGVSDCKVMRYNKFRLNSNIIAYFCTLIFCYRIGTFSAVVKLQIQNTSFSKERNHKGKTNQCYNEYIVF